MEYGGLTRVTRQGQITLPSKLRRALAVGIGDPLEVYYTGDLILIRKRRTPLEIFEELAVETRARFKRRRITSKIVAGEIQAARTGRG